MKTKNPFLILAAFLGASGVALGALGAHYLREKLKAGIIDQFQYEGFDKATKYQLMHALALLFIYVLYNQQQDKLLKATGWLFALGVLLFSGSIYALSTQNISGLNFRFLGPVTPLGGILMISGWICLFLYAIRANRSDR